MINVVLIPWHELIWIDPGIHYRISHILNTGISPNQGHYLILSFWSNVDDVFVRSWVSVGFWVFMCLPKPDEIWLQIHADGVAVLLKMIIPTKLDDIFIGRRNTGRSFSHVRPIDRNHHVGTE